jgi:nucleotide-binding universal stress UspA family protein
MKLQTVLWATDGSDGATDALGEAVDLVRLVGGRLIAAHCDQRFRGRAGDWSVDAGEDDTKKKIQGQVAELVRDGVDVDLVVQHSHAEAAGVIASMAAEQEADLIVCGTRGLGALGRIFLGSFTQRLLHIAPCPVLVVPEREASSDAPKERSAAAAGVK